MAFRRRAFTLTELLIATAIVVALGAILYPLFKRAREDGRRSPKPAEGLLLAARQYGADYDDRTPISINGPWRNLKNVADGALTQYGERRTDAWPLLLMPYVKSRSAFVDRARGDTIGIWSGPALATSDPGYVATKNSYRSQNRFPMFGYNYIFLGPILIPPERATEAMPIDFAVSRSHAYLEAEDPAATVFFVPSQEGYTPATSSDNLGRLMTDRGSFTVNAPGTWFLSDPSSSYVLFWNGTRCSGDWCIDINQKESGSQKSTQSAYLLPSKQGNTVMFLDGHSAFLKDSQMAAGTNYLTATPFDSSNDGLFAGGAVINDKSKYIWNLNQQSFEN